MMDLPKVFSPPPDERRGIGSALIKIWIFATFMPFASGSTATIISSSPFPVTTRSMTSTGTPSKPSSPTSSISSSSNWSHPSNCSDVCVCIGSEGNTISYITAFATSILASSSSSSVNMSYSTGTGRSFPTSNKISSFQHRTSSSMACYPTTILGSPLSSSVSMSYSTGASVFPPNGGFSSFRLSLSSTASNLSSKAFMLAETCWIEVQCSTNFSSVSATFNATTVNVTPADPSAGNQYDNVTTSFVAHTSSTPSTATSTSSENRSTSSMLPNSFASSIVENSSSTPMSNYNAAKSSKETDSLHSTAPVITSPTALTSSSSTTLISPIFSASSTNSHGFTAVTSNHGADTSSTDTLRSSASSSLLLATTSKSSSLIPSVSLTFSTLSISSSLPTSSITPVTSATVSSAASPSLLSTPSTPSTSQSASFISTTSPDSTYVISPTATATIVASSTAQIVYAPAPQVTSVKFSETAAKILIQFNVEVQFVSAEETCDKFFTNVTVTTLGGNAKCSLSHTRKLQITLGEAATINVGDLIQFKADVLKAHNEENGRFLFGSFSVDLPDVHLKPVPVIKGPNVLSSCGNLFLFGSQSFGSGGRPLIFKWSLISPNAGSNVTAITDILSNLSSKSDRVEIPGSLVESNETYLFKLEVANFLNTSDFEETTHSVIKVSDPVPALTLSSSIDLGEGEVFVSEEFHIRATVTVAPCASDARVQISWAVTCSDPGAKDKVESSDGFRATKSQNTLKLSKGVFTSDVNCTFTVTASMKYDPSVKTSISQDIKALPSPLEAAILGGDRLIGRNSGAIKLDAKTLTIDPDGTNHELSCSWSCAVLGGGLCNATVDNDFIFSAVNGCIAEVQSNHFFAGKTYVISVDVTKGSRSAVASIELTVVEGEPPAVWVDVARIKMNSNDRLTLQGYYKTNTEPTMVEWSCSKEQGFSFVDLSGYNPVTSFNPGNNSFVLLTLPVNLLKPDSKYRFKLTVNEGSEKGEASLTVHVRAGPTAAPSAGLSVTPRSVEALDVVTLSASGWVTDQDAYPLRYSFGLLVEKDVCEAFGIPSSDLEREQIVPRGSSPDYILSLCVVVLDKFDSFAITTFKITSSPPSSDDLTPDALESLLQSAVDNPLQSGNVDGALGAVMSIVDTVQTSNETTDEVKANISRRTEEVVLDIVESTVIDQDLAFPLLTVLVKTNVTASENSSRTANAALKILQKLDDKPLSDDLAEDFYTWVADLADDSIDNNVGLKETVGDALEKFADNIGTELKCGDPPREVSDDRLGSVKVQVAELKEEILSSSKPGAPRFDPGPQLSKEYSGTRECGGGKICCGVFLKMIRYEKNLIVADEGKQSDDSQVVSSQIIGVDLRDPITKTPIVIQSLAHPLKLFFFIPSVPKEKKLGCVYFDDDKMIWLKTGLKAVGPVSSNFTCESTHATYFAPSHDSVLTKEQSSTDVTGAIVGLVMGLLMGLLAVLLVFLFILWKRHQKVTTELPQLDDRL